MQSSLAVTALMMGLAGGPHCIVMCGAACAGMGAGDARKPDLLAMVLFQVGRVVGYSTLGALAASSMQGLGWLTVQSAALRPVWTFFHVALMLLGLMLLWQARQPVWLEALGRQLWARARTVFGQSGRLAPLGLGVAWALLPCGLLYSALAVATLAAHPLEGAALMALFVAGTSVSLMAGPWLWLRLRKPALGAWGVRLAGLALAGSAVWALWMGLAHNQAPWCVTP